MSENKTGLPGRNDPCHCGSGKKYKKCCMIKDDAADHKNALSNAAEMEKAAEEARKADKKDHGHVHTKPSAPIPAMKGEPGNKPRMIKKSGRGS